MLLSGLDLSKRLERAEGFASARFAEARRRLFPESGAEWIECGGVYAIFDGVDSPVTQTFGLGLGEAPSPDLLNHIERFFIDRGAPVLHEVSPLAGIPTLDLLCACGYRPIEISSVLYRRIEKAEEQIPSPISVRTVSGEELRLWTQISNKGWTSDYPELADFFRDFQAISAARAGSVHFLACFDGTPGAAGSLCMHEGVALFAGASTLPELRRRGLQAALLQARLMYAYARGCDVASMAAEAGSQSQHNAERNGFRIAYTRTKWRLASPAAQREEAH